MTTGLHGNSSVDEVLTGDILGGEFTGDVLSGVGHLGDVTTKVGDITHIGNVDVGGVLSGNEVDF